MLQVSVDVFSSIATVDKAAKHIYSNQQHLEFTLTKYTVSIVPCPAFELVAATALVDGDVWQLLRVLFYFFIVF